MRARSMMRPMRVARTLSVAPTPVSRKTGATASWMTSEILLMCGPMYSVLRAGIMAKFGIVATLSPCPASKSPYIETRTPRIACEEINMKGLLLAALIALPIAAHADGDISKVNGAIHVTAPAGDVDTVNGSITVDSG